MCGAAPLAQVSLGPRSSVQRQGSGGATPGSTGSCAPPPLGRPFAEGPPLGDALGAPAKPAATPSSCPSVGRAGGAGGGGVGRGAAHKRPPCPWADWPVPGEDQQAGCVLLAVRRA